MYGSINKENGNVSLNVFVQRGMRVLPLSMIGFCCKDIFSSISLLIDSLVFPQLERFDDDPNTPLVYDKKRGIIDAV